MKWPLFFLLVCWYSAVDAQDTLTCGVDLINTDSLILDKATNQPYTGFTRCIDNKMITYGYVENGKWHGVGRTFEQLKLKGAVPEGPDSLYTWYEGKFYRLIGDGYINHGVVEQERYYYYYKKNSLRIQLTSIQQGSGVDYTYYKNGNLESTMEIKDGIRHGETRFYYENSGALFSREEYVEGKRNGESVYYYESGAVKEKTIYKDGEKVEGPYYYKEDGTEDTFED